jgi:hypothetical protein
MKEHFPNSGLMNKKVREFEKPKFRESSKGTPKTVQGKKFKPKQAGTNPNMRYRDRKSIGVVM